MKKFSHACASFIIMLIPFYTVAQVGIAVSNERSIQKYHFFYKNVILSVKSLVKIYHWCGQTNASSEY